jgi:toxin ParE1/3/4
MAPQFYLTQPAIQDIEAIADYIAGQTGLQQAERFLSKLNAKFARITQFPNWTVTSFTWIQDQI